MLFNNQHKQWHKTSIKNHYDIILLWSNISMFNTITVVYPSRSGGPWSLQMRIQFRFIVRKYSLLPTIQLQARKYTNAMMQDVLYHGMKWSGATTAREKARNNIV